MSQSEQSDPRPLIFRWRKGPGMSPFMPVCVFAAVILHALSFYFFQISYPPAVSIKPPPAQLRILLPEEEESRVLLERIEREDPSLMLLGSRRNLTLPDFTRGIPYIPSFTALTAEPLPPPERSVHRGLPDAFSPEPVRMTSPAAIKPQAEPSESVLRFSDGLNQVTVPPAPRLPASSSQSTPTEPGVFLVAIRPDGSVQHIFQIEGNSSQTFSTLSREWISSCKFAESRDAGLRWGSATIYWGGDVHPDSVQ
jgi:hypothetical protein